MKLSIVIPILNEQMLLPDLLSHLQPFIENGCNVIFVDGGSQDDSVEFLELSHFKVLHSAEGRARQMNLGAAHASGDVVIFLHADTRLPVDALLAIDACLHQGRYDWGRFDVTIAGRSNMLKMVAFMMNLRSRLTGIATGDQAIFIRRSLFYRVGGFPDQPLMEDIELCRRLKPLSPACLRQRVVTSGRRWETQGVWRTIFLMWRLRWNYWRGVAIEKIAAKY